MMFRMVYNSLIYTFWDVKKEISKTYHRCNILNTTILSDVNFSFFYFGGTVVVLNMVIMTGRSKDRSHLKIPFN